MVVYILYDDDELIDIYTDPAVAERDAELRRALMTQHLRTFGAWDPPANQIILNYYVEGRQALIRVVERKLREESRYEP